jgi:hypothetical protein
MNGQFSNMDPMSDADWISAKLTSVRRRLFWVLFVDSLSTAACGLIFLWALFSIFQARLTRPPLVVAGWASCTCVFAAALISFFKVPSAKTSAKFVDRRLKLEQRLETAYECLAPQEEIEWLLLRDARLRLIHFRPSAVAPMRLGGATKVVLSVGLIACTSLGMLQILNGWNRLGLRDAGNPGPLIGQASNQAPDKGSAAKSKSGVARSPVQSAAPGMSNMPPDSGPARKNGGLAPSSADMVAPPMAAQAGSTPGTAQSPVNPQAPVQGNPAISKAAAPAVPAQPISPGTAQPSPSVPQTAGSVSTNAGAPSTSGTASIRALERRANSQPAGAPSAPDARGDAGSAGAARGQGMPPGQAAVSKSDAAFLARFAGQYQANVLAAEKALAKDSIPAGFRKYIAAYFAAIHP